MKFFRLSMALVAILALAFNSHAEEEEYSWNPIGKGVFRENFLHAFYNISYYPELEVEVEECEQIPGRYRMVNPYANYPDLIGSPGCFDGDYYIVVDASDPVHCYVTTCKAGYSSGQGQMLIVGSIADDYYNVRYGDWQLADEEKRCGKLVDGCITFPKNALLASNWMVDEPWSDDIYWKVVDNDMFRLKLPGAPNLDINSEFLGINEDKTELRFNISIENDVEKALVAFVKDAGENVADNIISGTIPSQEITANGQVVFPYTGDGSFTLVVIPFWQGTPRQAYKKVMEISFDESVWRKAGKALYREGIISSVDEMIPYGFVYPAYEYFVDVEENVESPGYIRLVDPYGDACPLSSGYSYDDSRKWYLYIDASNPAKTVIKLTDGGIGLNLGYGVMRFWSKADRAKNDFNFFGYGYSDAQIEQANWFGKFQNNEITFPKDAISMNFIEVAPTLWYQANHAGEFRIKFEPGQILGAQLDPNGIDATVADSDNSPAIFFNLDGSRADSDNLAPGIYIVRKGAKTFKTVIK